MKAWTEDAVEQIATAEILNSANTSTGERLALVICDNAIEYMMIAYTEMEKHLVHKTIKPDLWDGTKRAHHRLLQWTASQSPAFAAHASDIASFHTTRNTLYHAGTPISVKAAHVGKYLKIAKDVVSILFSENLSDADWDRKVAVVNQAIAKQTGKTIKAATTIETQDGAVKVSTSASLTNIETLCVVLGSFVSKLGQEPTMGQLETSLALSSASHLRGPNLTRRIYDCRKKKLIQKDALRLTAKGEKLVVQKTTVT